MLIGTTIAEVLAVLWPMILGLIFMSPALWMALTGKTEVPYRIARQFGMKTVNQQVWFHVIAMLVGIFTMSAVTFMRPAHTKHKLYRVIEHVTEAQDANSRKRCRVT